MAMLGFFYFGEANVYQENLDTFLAFADELKLKGLNGPDKSKDTSTGAPSAQSSEERTVQDSASSNYLSEPFFRGFEVQKLHSNFSKVCEKCHIVFNDRDNWTKHIRKHPN